MTEQQLLDAWARDHGANSLAAERLRRRDRVVCNRMAEVGERLRELGVTPPVR